MMEGGVGKVGDGVSCADCDGQEVKCAQSQYLAHKQDAREQTIIAHAKGTAELAEQFAEAFGMGAQGKVAGYLHDTGKYSSEFQKRIRNPEQTGKCDHATAGAWEARQMNQVEIAMCIAGHHSGLLNWGSRWDDETSATFSGRMKKAKNRGIPDYSAWLSERNVDELVDLPPVKRPESGDELYWRIKFLYSALVDADFLDTERFVEEDAVKRKYGIEIDVLCDRLKAYLQKKGWLKARNGLNGMRTEILELAARKGREAEQGAYKLTVPTGGGKTVSSLRFALQHAKMHGMKRIIYVVPYVNIIEQTANTFREILGEDAVLEHHSNVEYQPNDEGKWDWKKLACENWDMSVIVTTAVQFFESLFHNKSSKCRKLHNIANSVIVYDEVQMLPIKYWSPCVSVMQELSNHYHVTQIFCSATQPEIEFSNKLEASESTEHIEIPEIMERKEEYFQRFKRVTFRDAGQVAMESLAEKIREKTSVLCIVNTKRTAKELFALLADEPDVFFLTTMMVPEHRWEVLQEIKRRLCADVPKPCRLIATSLVEAGVDLDFAYVLRELAGLDSILQAAGRCNRNGRRSVESSITEVFSLESGPHKPICQQVDATKRIMGKYKAWDSLEAIKNYFVFYRALRGKANLDCQDIKGKMERYEFEEIAKAFHLIDEETYTVYVPWKGGADLIEQLRRGIYNRDLLRRLGRYSVNLFRKHYEEWLRLGNIELVGNVAVLNNQCLYSEQTGMEFQAKEGEAIFF